jgi:secondary thiamine-phosphate synthase enzyme
MRQALGDITVETRGQGLYECTDSVVRWLSSQNITDGLLTLFIRHTSASLIIQENADPDVIADLNRFFQRLVAEDPKLYAHTAEGPDDMPAHIRAALTQTNLSIPVMRGRLALGTWQGIYVFEHRRAPQRRRISLHVTGE